MGQYTYKKRVYLPTQNGSIYLQEKIDYETGMNLDCSALFYKKILTTLSSKFITIKSIN